MKKENHRRELSKNTKIRGKKKKVVRLPSINKSTQNTDESQKELEIDTPIDENLKQLQSLSEEITLMKKEYTDFTVTSKNDQLELSHRIDTLYRDHNAQMSTLALLVKEQTDRVLKQKLLVDSLKLQTANDPRLDTEVDPIY